jgi:hypothetical protein
MSKATTGTTTRPWPRRMGRKMASDYLREEHGIRLSESSLAKLAVTGGGPLYFKDGPFVVHDRVDHLDAYAVQRLGKARTSTSDQAA